MFSFLRHGAIIVLLGLLAPFVEAQTAPDITPGMSFESVLSAYGWPKGRSAAESREIWVYESFQVVFDNGRVVRVSPIVPAKGQPKRATAPLANVQPPVKSSPSPITPQPAGTTPPSANPSSATLARPGDRPFVKDAAAPAPRPTPTLPGSAWVALVLAGVAAVTWAVVSSRRRLARNVRKRAAREEAASSLTAEHKTWKEAIAAKIAKTASPLSTATPLGGNDEPPALLTELSPWLLERLEWKRFELLVSLYFKATGVRADATRTGAGAQLYRPGEDQPYACVRCKAWEKAVGIKPVREHLEVMAANQVPEGVFVTTGVYSDDASEFARQNRITAITGRDLVNRFNQLAPEIRSRILTTVTEGDYTTPTCPNCDLKLVLIKTEPPFWGCRNHPRCQTKISVRSPRRS